MIAARSKSPVFMAVGFLTGLFLNDTAPFSRLILPLTFLMVYPMMVTMQYRKILEGGDGKVQWAAQIINFLIIPLIAWLLGRLFFADSPYLALGFLLVSLLPTSGMTISWTGMAKGNMEAAVKMTVVGLFLGSLLTPFYIKALMGASVSIPLVKIFTQIAVIVALPMLLGGATQALLIQRHGKEKFGKEIKKQFPPYSTLGVLLMVYTAMVLKAKAIMADPLTFLGLIVPLLVLYLVNLAIAMTSLGREGSEIALVTSLGYIIQIQVSALYVKQHRRFFRKGGAVSQGEIKSA